MGSTIRVLLAAAVERLGEVSNTPLLDTHLLLGKVTGMSRAGVIAHDERALSAAEYGAFLELVERRARGEPVAYLIGSREFYGLDFEVSAKVLIPRPETELLVTRACELAADLPDPLRILDLGCGSGCIGIAIAHELVGLGRRLTVCAIDRSSEALDVAGRNAVRLGVANVFSFLESDWYGALYPDERCFDLIVSNPPYIAEGDPEVSPEVHFEPPDALYAGRDGLSAIREIVSGAPAHLCAHGVLLFEFGRQSEEQLRELVTEHAPRYSLLIHHDLAGRARVGEVYGPRPARGTVRHRNLPV